MFFFFQAEDGIRDKLVTGVQTCALPILLVHDSSHAEPSLAFALSRVTQATHGGTPVGIFRNIERPVYDDLMAEQLKVAEERGKGDLAELLHSGETWVVS